MTPRDSRESVRHHSDVQGYGRGEFGKPTRDRQRRRWRPIFPALALLALASLAGPAPALETTEGTEALRFFLDCDSGCDFDFLRSQITYVNWVRDRMETDFRAEDRRDSQSYQASGSAGRTTDMWRMGMGAYYSYRESNFEFEDGSTYRSVSHSTSYFGRVIRTLAPHWGLGVGASSRQSTYLNLDNSYRTAAAVEYNIFPYSESSEREFTFAYFIGGTRLDYEEVTVFDKLSETFADQGAFIAFGMERPWGEAHLDLQYSHFIDDFDRSRIEFSSDVEYHILRGLSFDVYAGVSRIRDQIYLPKGGASDAEVLVARRQLETDLTFRGGIQLRYTFGSIYNNVVNSRLSSDSGGFSRIF